MTVEPESAGTPEQPLRPSRGARWWLTRGALALAAGFAAVVAFAYVLPREPVVTRSIDLALPAAKVLPLVADLRHFPEWSPWFVPDPAIAITFTGPLDGLGQTLTWNSKLAEVGTGKMTVTAADNNGADILVAFADQGTAKSWFRLQPKGEALTTVAWSFSTDLGMSPINRYSGLWIGNIVGPDFERGLARLKAVAEAAPKPG
ncbi:hypothetical protein BH10PSE9_BH10PSE9_20180 [soil metagenome]